jgi:hypothetical protein
MPTETQNSRQGKPDTANLFDPNGEPATITKYKPKSEETPEMLSQSNDIRIQPTKRLFLAVINQAIADVLENGKQAKEAERWLLSKDFDALDRSFLRPASQRGSRLQKGISGVRKSLAESRA